MAWLAAKNHNISFISAYSKDQFIVKLGHDNSRLQVALLPLDTKPAIRKYLHQTDSKKEIVVIVGNKFKHKGVDIALKELPVWCMRTFDLLLI